MNDDKVGGELRMGLGRAESVIGDAMGDAEFKLRGKADQVIGRVQSAYGGTRDAVDRTFDEVDAFVTERPYLTALMAVVAGLAAGYILGVGRPKVLVIKPASPARG
jgi:uncharacterized protein YjbJ (UPF0337 family)